MMLRKRFEGIGLLGVPPRPTVSPRSFFFIASDTSPGLRSGGAGAGSGSSACVGKRSGPGRSDGQNILPTVVEISLGWIRGDTAAWRW